MNHNQKIVNTLSKGWHCYGKLMAKNEYASSLPRATAKLRETLDTRNSDTSKGLIGVLKFEGKSYKWFERMDGKVKYFYLEETAERNNFVEQNISNITGQTQLINVRSLEAVS